MVNQSSVDLSVVIPTTGQRNRLLQRAIASALEGVDALRVEVIVVHNGVSNPTAEFEDPRVKSVQINQRNVCAARNMGLKVAAGHYVRFLDDDDFLLPQVAALQFREAVDLGLDISSFAIRSEDESGEVMAVFRPPTDADFCAAQLGPQRMQLPHAHLYRRELARAFRWNEDLRVSEDIAWLQSIAAGAPQARWGVGNEVVGVWFQHREPRASFGRAAHEPHFNTAESIIRAVQQLRTTDALSAARADAAARGLWDCIHKAFYRRPLYWHGVARFARDLLPGSHPSIPLYDSALGAMLNPLLLEWAMIPKRWGNELARNTIPGRRKSAHVRTL